MEMEWYKILAQILLMLSLLDLALAAPVLVQERETTTSIPTRSESLDSGNWPELEPRQHNPMSWWTDSNDNNPPTSPSLRLPPAGFGLTSPSLMSRSPTDEPVPLNPSLPHYPLMGQNLDLSSFPQANTPKFKSLSELTGMSAPTDDTPHPDGSPQISSSSESDSSDSWVPADYDPGPVNSWLQPHVPPPASPPESSPSPKSKHLSDLTSAPTDDTPHPDGSPQISSSEPTPGPTNEHLPSTGQNPPPTQNPKRPRPEGSKNELESSLTKIFKGRL